MTLTANRSILQCLVAITATALAACASIKSPQPPHPGAPIGAATIAKGAELSSYFDMLELLAPGDEIRQATAFASVQATAQENPTSSNRLKYAIALGAAGHPASNPVEARRLIAELLAGTHDDLRPPEVALAEVYLREFDARVALYADLARQREESERKLQAMDADDDRRYNTLNIETQRLRKALAEAERKLEAVAEMERALAPETKQ